MTNAAKRNDQFLVLLVVLFTAASWLFFKPFIVATLLAGAGAAVLMRRWHARHPSLLPYAARTRTPEINLSGIPVGGDAAGLLFAAGSVAVVIVGVPNMAWYFLTALGCALLLACGLFTVRGTRARQSLGGTTLGLR